MDFNTIEELLLHCRSHGLAYSSVSYNDRRILLVALRGGTDSYIFNEFTGERERNK